LNVLFTPSLALVPLNRTPLHISRLEVTVSIYAHQPVIRTWLIPDMILEIHEGTGHNQYARRARGVARRTTVRRPNCWLIKIEHSWRTFGVRSIPDEVIVCLLPQ
jgi:hypothetical protein